MGRVGSPVGFASEKTGFVKKVQSPTETNIQQAK